VVARLQEYIMLAKTTNSYNGMKVERMEIELSLDTINVEINNKPYAIQQFTRLIMPDVSITVDAFGESCLASQTTFTIKQL
jgi:hypothetical protein